MYRLALQPRTFGPTLIWLLSTMCPLVSIRLVCFQVHISYSHNDTTSWFACSPGLLDLVSGEFSHTLILNSYGKQMECRCWHCHCYRQVSAYSQPWVFNRHYWTFFGRRTFKFGWVSWPHSESKLEHTHLACISISMQQNFPNTQVIITN